MRSTHKEVRIDQFLAKRLPELSRAYIQKLIADEQVLVDGEVCERSDRVRTGTTIEVQVPAPKPCEVQAEDIALDIIYQDSDLVIVNKPVGMVVHPTTHDRSGTLVNALLHHVADLSGINGVERPGIVHRIDKDTSGLLVVAKRDVAHQHLSEQFRGHSVDRVYTLLCWGTPSPSEGTIQSSLGRSPRDRRKMASLERSGKHAVTHYRVIENYGPVCMVECALETGRTHQIRVHLSERGHPLVGDPVYGGIKKRLLPDDSTLRALLEPLRGQMLHAGTLGFIHPTTDAYVHFNLKPPEPMASVIRGLRRHAGLAEDAPGPWDRSPEQPFLGDGHTLA
ncbi:MAG TPA: RNA pseudouridine synthase [Deltaproteobacteria bacterium]|nr:RNA pseudouridine synthase [Deltaproteobacteria bacterium]HCP44980.1 RNA pseudouridine synthase [Deltaproteobacteria bacterium]